MTTHEDSSTLWNILDAIGYARAAFPQPDLMVHETSS